MRILKNVLLLSVIMILTACGSGSFSDGIIPGGPDNSVYYGYYTGNIIYPDNSTHPVVGFFSGSNKFLLKETQNQFGYKILVSLPFALNEISGLPSYSSLYMKAVDGTTTFATNNFKAGVATNTDVENGQAILMTNVSQIIALPNITFNFTINDQTNTQFSGSYKISLIQSTNPNDAILLPNPVSPGASYADFTEQAWSTTDPQTNLSVVLGQASDCTDVTGTCPTISGLESGGNGNLNTLGADGNFCSLSLNYVGTGSNHANFYPMETCSDQSYFDNSVTYYAWISVDNNGNQTLHTLYDYENMGILYDLWSPAGPLSSRT